jgi:cell division protein FtsX
MKAIGFYVYQGWRTLWLRPGLSLLAMLLLSFALWLCAALLGTLLLLENLRRDLLANLATDIELSHDVTDEQRAHIASLAKQWPGTAEVNYISPDSALQLYSAEVGEDLRNLFSGNPFPPVLRVRFKGISHLRIDSLAARASQWEGVVGVIYPREIWQRFDKISGKIRGSLGFGAIGFFVVSLGMVALALRAQFMARRKEWRLLTLLGMTPAGLRRTAQVHSVLIGILAGVVAVMGMWVLLILYGFAFLEKFALPVWFYVEIVFAGIVFMLPIGSLIGREGSGRRG